MRRSEDWPHLFLIISVIAIAIYMMFPRSTECEAKGGKVVRGVWSYECVKEVK